VFHYRPPVAIVYINDVTRVYNVQRAANDAAFDLQRLHANLCTSSHAQTANPELIVAFHICNLITHNLWLILLAR